MLSVALCVAICAAPALLVQDGESDFDLDALLSVVDPVPGPLACTGRLLSMEFCAPVPGFLGQAAFGDAWPDTTALLRAEFAVWGALQVPVLKETVQAPSHLRRTFDLGRGLTLVEHAFITGDDAAVLIMTFKNGEQEEHSFDLLISSDLTPEPDRSQSRQQPVGLLAGQSTIPLWLDGVDFRLVQTGTEGPGQLSCGAFAVPDVTGARAVLHLLVSGDEPVDGGTIEALFSDGSRGRPASDDARRLSATRPGGGPGATHIVSWAAPPGRFFRQLIVVGETDGPRAISGPLVLAATLEVLPVKGRPPVLRGSFAWPRDQNGPGEGTGRAVHATLAATDAVVVMNPYPYAESWSRLGDGGRGSRSGRGLLQHVALMRGEEKTLQAVLALAGRPLVSFLQALGRTEDEHSLERHQQTYGEWFTRYVPDFSCSAPHVERSWWAGWVELRRRLVTAELAGGGSSLFVDRRVPEALASAEALPELAANLRWLRERRPLASQLRAFARQPVPAAVLLTRTLVAGAEDPDAPARALRRALELLPPGDELRGLADSLKLPAGDDALPSGLVNRESATPDEILRRLTGIEFLTDGSLQLNPQPGTLEHFRFERIPFSDHELGVSWDRPGGPPVYADRAEGLTITLDGATLFHSAEPQHFVLRRVGADQNWK
jgi:hypothetical protein